MKIHSDSFDTADERLEKWYSFKDHSPSFWRRGIELNPDDNVCVVKGTTLDNGEIYKQWQWTHNMVTSVGDEYYAKKIAGKNASGSAYGDSDFQTDGIAFHVGSATRGCMVLGNGSVGTIAQGDTYAELAGELDASSGSGRNSTKELRTNYPRFSDNDSDNTGGAADQVTWSYEWATGDFNTTSVNDLTGGVIVDRAGNATPADTTKILTRFSFASAFEKTASDTLKVFVNHTFEGAGT
jgi:hypothetical protein